MTDSALVCTELVFKAYEPNIGGQGLWLPAIELMGRLAMPANEIVRQFDEQFGWEGQQFDLIAFLDGNERAKRRWRSFANVGAGPSGISWCRAPAWIPTGTVSRR